MAYGCWKNCCLVVGWLLVVVVAGGRWVGTGDMLTLRILERTWTSAVLSVSTEQIRKDSCWNELAAHIGCNIKKNDSHQKNPADHQKKLIGEKNISQIADLSTRCTGGHRIKRKFDLHQKNFIWMRAHVRPQLVPRGQVGYQREGGITLWKHTTDIHSWLYAYVW